MLAQAQNSAVRGIVSGQGMYADLLARLANLSGPCLEWAVI
jgi:hypothetical protein